MKKLLIVISLLLIISTVVWANSTLIIGVAGVVSTVAECDADHLELCTTQEICEAASLNWCDNACQVEECEAPATYDFREGAEGTGYENTGWTESGTVNEDYTTTVLKGSQSISLAADAFLYRAANYDNAAFMFRTPATFASNSIFAFSDGGNVLGVVRQASDGTTWIKHGNTEAYDSTVLSANTNYYVWVVYAPGTGANGTMSYYLSTTSTKPASPLITTSTGTATAAVAYALCYGGNGRIFDDIILDADTIGNM